MSVFDTLSRPLRNLRVSVTDRCNLRCEYCMPEDDYIWLPREDVLRFEEISALVDTFIQLGVDRVRLTGGEPLLRRDLPRLLRMLAAKPGLRDLALTTNGVVLAEQAASLAAGGLRRITISLDTLRRDRFRSLTRFDELDRVKEGIAASARIWNAPGGLKIDSVILRGVNDDELVDLIEYGRTTGAEVRFIEYMDVGGATRWTPERVVSRAEILERLTERYGEIVTIDRTMDVPGISGIDRSAPAEQFALKDGTVFGIISSTTSPFCRTCDRSRLTADGVWYLCLYATGGIDLRGPLRRGASVEDLMALMSDSWRARDDRGAERRLALADRRTVVPLTSLRKDPHLEMHTRGG